MQTDHIPVVQSEAENVPRRTQSTRAGVLWALLVLFAPALSPFYFLFMLFYQFCLVEGALSFLAKGVTWISSVFFGVAWIPWLNAVIYFLMKERPTNEQELQALQINAFGPIIAFYVFAAWGSIIAFRHFSIADSFEAEEDRQTVRHMKSFLLEPPITIYCGDATPLVLKDAFDLYHHLKGKPKQLYLSSFFSVLMTTITVVSARVAAVSSGGELMGATKAIYVLSTIYFAGIMFVLYTSLVFVMQLYRNQVDLVTNLTTCGEDLQTKGITDNLPSIVSQRTIVSYGAEDAGMVQRVDKDGVAHIDKTKLSHIRAWDEVRSVAVFEMADPVSILNSFLTPTLGLTFFGAIGCYSYLVLRLLFTGADMGQLLIFLTALLVIFLIYMIVMLSIAKRAQTHFKRHNSIIAKTTFEVASNLDKLISAENRGIKKKYAVHQDPRFSHLTSKQQQELYDSLNSLSTYMVANLPRPIILGIEFRYVRYVIVIILLLNANILFFSLMVMQKKNSK